MQITNKDINIEKNIYIRTLLWMIVKYQMEQKISGKMDNLERLTEIFDTSFRKRSLLFDFVSEFPEILVNAATFVLSVEP